MESAGLIVILIFVVAAGIILFQTNAASVKNSFDDYTNDHPEAFKDGKITCYKCGGNSIYLKEIARGIKIVNAHVCRQCGSELYRSSM